jgi:hypothetical protein
MSIAERGARLDRFKAIVAIILALLLILLCLVLASRAPLAPNGTSTATPAAQATATQVAQAPTATAGSSTTITAPTVNAEAKEDGTLTLTGAGTPGSTVQIVVDGKSVGETIVGPDGNWTFNTTVNPGSPKIEVNALDASGQVAASAPEFTLNIPAFSLPVITLPTNLQAGANTLNGTGKPGAKLQIVVDGKPVGETTVGPDGNWSFNLDLPDGQHTVKVNELDANGAVVTSSPPLAITVGTGTAVGKAPTLDLPSTALYPGRRALTGTGTPGAKVQIVVDGKPVGEATVGPDGKWSFDVDFPNAGEFSVTVNELDVAGAVVASSEAATFTFSPLTLDALAASYAPGTITLGGSAAPGGRVQIVINGQIVGEATVGADGKWSYPHTFEQTGDYEIIINGLDAASRPLATTVPTTARIKAPATTGDVKQICDFNDPTVFGEDKGKFWLVDRCDTLSRIARVTNIALNAIITANPQVKNPDLIYPGWEIVLPGR